MTDNAGGARAERWRAIEALYHAACESDSSQRAELLSRAEPDVRREVESLLAQSSAVGPLDELADLLRTRRGETLQRSAHPFGPGTTLGPYTLGGTLGAGGMGVVYRARDTRLGRDVAIKVLPLDATRTGERRRVEREARAIAALNHPHICTLHDMGRERVRLPGIDREVDVDFLVMEHLEGTTLAAHLARGALPLDQVLRHGCEIADALDATHRAGIVHRDLKPGNVMITRSGAKLLDFGLARLIPAQARHPAPPADVAGTGEGALLGTLSYMAPEQIQGRETDVRTDIFALGALLYEMATGHRAFRGTDPAGVIAAILERDPPAVSTLQPLAPPALDHLVHGCLAKTPDDRWQSAHDVMKQLQWIGSRPMHEVVSGPVPRRPRVRSRWWAIAAAAALALAVGAVAALWSRPSPAVSPSFRFTISSLPVDPPRPSLAVSPDGRYVAFTAAASGGQPLLYVRPVDALEARPIAKTEGGASLPFWSPDSRHIGFGAAGRLKRVDLATGHVQNVAALGGDVFTGGTWNADGVILFSAGAGSGIKRVSQGGGEPSDVTRVSATEGATFHGLPSFLPDGRRFLFTVFFAGPFSSRERPGAVWVGSLDSATSRQVLSNSSRAIFASGYLLFNRADALLAQRFDAERLTFDGDPFLVAHGLSVLAPLGVGMFDASRTGVLAYEAGDEQSTVSVPAQGRLSWYDRSGTRLRSIGPPGHYAGIELSPDGRRIALHQHDEAGGGDIWILDQRGSSTRLTFDPGHDLAPVWSPDGQRILFASDRDGSFNLYHTLASGAGADELVLDSPDVTFPGDWSPAPDPARVLFDRFDGGARNVDVWMLPVDGPPTPRPLMLIGDGFTERTARFSPDGRWITYVSDESGRDEVYVRSYSSAGKWQVSKDGGRYPRWTRGGREIVYLQRAAGIGQDNVFTVMAVPISDDGTALSSGSPRAMFTADFNTSDIGPSYPYDVSVDSQQILVNERVALPDSPQPLSTATITVIVNWQAGLR